MHTSHAGDVAAAALLLAADGRVERRSVRGRHVELLTSRLSLLPAWE